MQITCKQPTSFNDSFISFRIKKILSIRLFSDCDKQWQKNVVEMDYEILLLSQFTLQAVTKNGSKPDFHNAMQTEASRVEFARIAQVLREKYSEERVKTGRFQTVCSVSLINDGPTTIVIDSKQK